MEVLLKEKEKKEHLKTLKDEVKEFHPVLNTLLPKLPRVSNTEYTHGTGEKGADFVIERVDDTLGSNEYIGVIVKTGSIHTDLSRLREQIRECNLPRYFLSGKKKIRLDEIWIITNEHITGGAIEKIHEEFSTTKIKFIQNTNLIKLIDNHMSSFWHEIPLEVGEYLSNISGQIVNQEQAFNLLPNCSLDFYIEQDITEVDFDFNFNSKKKKSKRKDIEKIQDIIEKNDFIFLEGKPGFGKSKLVRHSISYYSTPINFLKSKYIPIFIYYREFVDIYNFDSLKLVNEVKLKNNISCDDVTFLLFIDGFDEKVVHDKEEYDIIKAIWEQTNQNNNIKIIITSRPLSLDDPNEYKNLGVKFYELLPLNINKIVKFFEKICTEISLSSRIIEDIKKSDIFHHLPKSPIAAILLANLLNENSQDLPSNLTELYQKYSELMLGRWDVKKGLQSEKEYEASKELIKRISKYCIDNELTYVCIDEAKGYFTDYLNSRNLGIDPDLLFEKVTSRSGIIQKDSRNNRVYFKHKTFTEYFYASQMLRDEGNGNIDHRIYDPIWRNVYFFYFGIKKDCETVFQRIKELEPSKLTERFYRIVNFSDYLLAGYTTPYKVISDLFISMIKEAAIFYVDIVEGRIKTSLQKLPPMGILYFMQVIMKKGYSYNFFKEAIDEATIGILSDDDLDEQEKIIATFFIAILSLDLKLPNPFDGLLESFSKDLPLPIQLALHYESDELESTSQIVKKQEKKFEKLLKKSSQGFINHIKSLHQEPIENLLEEKTE